MIRKVVDGKMQSFFIHVEDWDRFVEMVWDPRIEAMDERMREAGVPVAQDLHEPHPIVAADCATPPWTFIGKYS